MSEIQGIAANVGGLPTQTGTGPEISSFFTPENRLSDHFTVEELTRVGSHREITNTPPLCLARNALKIAEKLEQARAIWTKTLGRECKVRISYAYRCRALNQAVGSRDTSAHLEFLAADAIPEGLTLQQAFEALINDPMFMADVDQLIIERGCIHIGLPPGRLNGKPRRELRLDSDGPGGIRQYPLWGHWTDQGVRRV